MDKELSELTEYYKYYTQTTILYQQNFFKLIHNHRERKKLVEYNRLKKVLNLSNSEVDSSQSIDHEPLASFKLLNNLTLTNREQESEVFKQL